MERKRIEKIVALLLVGILIPVSLFPFRINAATLTTSNITYNYYLTDVVDSTSQLADKNYIYDVDFVFDKSYLGWVSVSMITSYIYATGDTRQATYTKAIYVNGSTAKTSIVISSNFTGVNGSPLSSMSISVNNSNVTPMADLSTLDDILNVLTDIQNTLNIDVMNDLDQILIDVGLASDYLEILTKIKQWHFPIESFSSIYYMFGKYEEIGLTEFNYYTYPIFQVGANSIINRVSFNSNSTYVYIFLTNINIYNIDVAKQYITFDDANIEITKFTNINVFRYSVNNVNSFGHIFKIEITNKSSSAISSNITFNGTNYSILTPIYYNLVDYKYISTDFALQFGLTNRLLDDLDIIASGTQQSQSASGSLDQATSQFSDDANDLVTIEESFNNSMNQSLENVNPTFNMGSSFLTSANWVSQQFNRIVNNTPFASLITFGLTLGLGLLIIGKVRK